MSTDLEQLRRLPTAEKLHIVVELWEDISADDASVVVQEWDRTEAARRSAELAANPQMALTRDELWQRVDGTDG